MFSLLLILTSVTAGAGECQAPEAAEVVTVKTVVDGDTIGLSDGRKVRLIGLDTPEIGHHGKLDGVGAQAARQTLQRLIDESQGRVYLQPGRQAKDRYGRLLAHLFNIRRENLTQQLLLVGRGYQIAMPPNLAYLTCYLDAETAAHRAGIGLWQKAPREASSLQGDETGFHLLRGQVREVNSSRRGLWLKLQGGLTLHITWQDWKAFDLEDPQTLVGRRLEVRGWLYLAKGVQSLNVHHPSAIQWL